VQVTMVHVWFSVLHEGGVVNVLVGLISLYFPSCSSNTFYNNNACFCLFCCLNVRTNQMWPGAPFMSYIASVPIYALHGHTWPAHHIY
jgi:hypothetical protein